MPDEAVVLDFGVGKVAIRHFNQGSVRGLLLTDTGEEHPVGESFDCEAEQEGFKPGETVLRFANKESLDVLLEELIKCRVMIADLKESGNALHQAD